MATTSGQMTKTNAVNSRPPLSPMKTRRSSLRSSATAAVTPMSDSRSKIPAEVKPFLGSPTKPDSGARACPSVTRSVVPVLAQHIRQSVKYWTSKSTAVDAAAAMMTSQPCCSDVIDAVLLVHTLVCLSRPIMICDLLILSVLLFATHTEYGCFNLWFASS